MQGIRYIDPFQIAVQGAGFKLTPIALAVQGFITYLQDEAQKVNGGGKKPASNQPAQSQQNDDALIYQVLEKWEYIERIRQADSQQNVKPVLDKPHTDLKKSDEGAEKRAKPFTLAENPVSPIQQVQTPPILGAQLRQEPKGNHQDVEALLLILAEL